MKARVYLYSTTDTKFTAMAMGPTSGWPEGAHSVSFYNVGDTDGGIVVYMERAQMYRLRDLLSELLMQQPTPYPGVLRESCPPKRWWQR